MLRGPQGPPGPRGPPGHIQPPTFPNDFHAREPILIPIPGPKGQAGTPGISIVGEPGSFFARINYMLNHFQIICAIMS